jgi:nitroreductase/FMN reductase [NAD(P)H]
MTSMPVSSYSLVHRFGPDAGDMELHKDAPPVHIQLGGRGSVRAFQQKTIPDRILRQLCALALCAPTKSDLQQRDIIIIDSQNLRSKIGSLMTEGPGGQEWLANVPNMLIFCGNNHRQRMLHVLRGKPFVNDHFDAFLNAAVDAAIALSAFVIAAEASGLGTCPISAVRTHSKTLSRLLKLPDYVFPVAGLAVGYRAALPSQSLRLPLAATVHHNAYTEGRLEDVIDTYDRRRAAVQPYKTQRYVDEFGAAEAYGWSEDKARQYARPERSDFGAYVRKIGFKLD